MKKKLRRKIKEVGKKVSDKSFEKKLEYARFLEKTVTRNKDKKFVRTELLKE